MEFPRKQYLDQLVRKKDNGRVKVITGLRRCGKSYLLFSLYRQFLLASGVAEDQIITIILDEIGSARYRDPFALDRYVRERIRDPSRRYYVFIDEIQFVAEIPNPYVDDPGAKLTFTDVVLGLMKIPNADIYVTGSNSRMLSSDVLTQFRDRGDEIRVCPLSFAEVCGQYQGDHRWAWRDYLTYGGMPMVWGLGSHEERSRYLRDLISRTYIRDVLERYQVRNNAGILETILNVLASAVGSLTNPCRLSRTFASEHHVRVAPDTISSYIGYFLDAFLIRKAERWDVKGRRHLSTPVKYYFADPGLRNATLAFRQQEETHLMENVIFNDLVRRGFDVDVGVVEQNLRDDAGKKIRRQLEVDFVVNRGDERFYVQSALTVADPEKRAQECASLLRILDSFRKIVVVRDYIRPWQDDNGIRYVGVEDFLLDEDLLTGR